jgi:hypothetical protein
MVAEPTPCGVTVTVVPDTVAVAMAELDEVGVYVERPPEIVDVCVALAGSTNVKLVGESVIAAPTVTPMVQV